MRDKLKTFFKINLRLHIYLLASAALILLFYLLSPLKTLMTFISNMSLWIKRFLAAVCSIFPFSVAELLIALSALFCAAYIIKCVADAVRTKPRLALIYRRFVIAVCAVLSVYFLLCVFLNASYFAADFQEQSGIYARPATTDGLYRTTEYFVTKLNETAAFTVRDENGVFNESLTDIFENSRCIYDNIGQEYPFLAAPSLKPKSALSSKLMSCFGYTGFYFPFTGEANINTDAPLCFIPVTIAHEFAHQRGIASELEANFAAIIASVSSGVPEYEYSGWLFGYINLSNALYKQDYERFAELYHKLPTQAVADLNRNNEYWARFEGPAAEAGEAVYDSFLKTQGVELGTKSYGAVVDMLIVYFRAERAGGLS